MIYETSVSMMAMESLTLYVFLSYNIVSVSVVFEREKCDAILLKFCKKLKKVGYDTESYWLETQTSKFNQRDFKIKKSNINLAREKEGKPKKKSIGKASKVDVNAKCSDIIQVSREPKGEISCDDQDSSSSLVQQMVRGSMITVGELVDSESEEDDDNSIVQDFLASENEDSSNIDEEAVESESDQGSESESYE